MLSGRLLIPPFVIDAFIVRMGLSRGREKLADLPVLARTKVLSAQRRRLREMAAVLEPMHLRTGE